MAGEASVTGAEAALRAALSHGVEVCFANPGTTELPLVAALDRLPGIRPVLGLFEGVCTGAADGYARMAGKPALTLLHLGPGLANGLANLHNARRAGTPVVNLVGDHATWHVNADPPLAADIEALAGAVSCWVRTTRSAGEAPRDMAEAIGAAAIWPGGVATLIFPSDCQWAEVNALAAAPAPPPRPGFSAQAVQDAADLLRQGAAALLLGGQTLSEQGLRAAERIAAATGCRLLCERVPARIERGGGLPAPERLLYFPEQLASQLAGLRKLVLAGCREPVAFFGYEGGTSRPLPPGIELASLAVPGQDVLGALRALEDELGPARAAPPAPPADSVEPAGLPPGPLTRETLGACLRALTVDNAIVVDESVTQNRGGFLLPAGAPRHTYLSITGGAIGFGLPCAVGAAVACPDRPVLAVQADGSAMYTLQALWTQAREGLNVTTLLCSNRSYAILRGEMRRAGGAEAGPAAARLTDLGSPDIDWVSLARGLGVPGVRVDTAEDCLRALERALGEPGPCLIEADLHK